VQAVNAVGVGAFSMPIRVTTRALPPFPPTLELVSVGSNSVKLKWGDGKNVDLLRYVLEMRRDDYGRHVLSLTVSTATLTIAHRFLSTAACCTVL